MKEAIKYLTPDEVKAELTNMLKWFNRFAEENHIRYSLIGGTLIGAVRHKGFIPWDDDIDLAVTRETYNRILSFRDKVVEDSNGRFDINSLSNGTSEFPFIKLVHKEIKVKQVDIESKSGDYLWIDIFPFDAVPENFDEVERFCKKIHRYRLCLESALLKSENVSHLRLSSTVKKIMHPVFRLIGAEWFGKKIDRLSQSYSDKDTGKVCSVVWGYGAKESLTLEDFITYTQVTFEGEVFPALKAWDRYLTNTYGDYMQLPPVEKRASHELVAWHID